MVIWLKGVYSINVCFLGGLEVWKSIDKWGVTSLGKSLTLKRKLLEVWKSIEIWGITSLGKGYFEFSLSSLEDVIRFRSIYPWNINPGFLKLFPWSKDCNPNFLKQNSVQVWAQTHGLAQEY